MTVNIKELDEQILKTWRLRGIMPAIILHYFTMDIRLIPSRNYVENLVLNKLKTSLESESATENSIKNQIIILIKREQKLEAVKLYIDETNCSLTQGENYVDALTEKFFIA